MGGGAPLLTPLARGVAAGALTGGFGGFGLVTGKGTAGFLAATGGGGPVAGFGLGEGSGTAGFGLAATTGGLWAVAVADISS